MKHNKLFSLTALLLAALLAFTACGAAPSTPTEVPETTIPTEAPAETAAPVEAKTRTVPETITTEVFVGDMTITSSTVHSYDQQGLLMEIISYSNGAEVSRTTAENDEHGEVIRQTAVSGESTMVTESELTYDEKGNLIHRVDTVSENGTVRQTAYFPDGTPSPSYTLTTYNGQGNPLTQETYNGDVLAMRMTYTYITVPAFK